MLIIDMDKNIATLIRDRITEKEAVDITSK